MKFHTLAGLITTALLLSACNPDGTLSDNTAESSNASTEPVPAAAVYSDKTSLAYLLATGYSGADTVAYWNCSVQGPDNSVENLHMRFWENGRGFSGADAITWQLVGENGIDIVFDGGSFDFRDVSFSSSEQEDDLLSASSGTNDNVLCQRKGPLRAADVQLRGGINMEFSDPALGLLESHLLNQAGTSWTCQEQDRQGSVFVVNYEFLNNTTAKLNGEAGRWFVDERYNVVLSIDGEVRAIRDVQFQDPEAGRTHFLAGLYDRALDCSLT